MSLVIASLLSFVVAPLMAQAVPMPPISPGSQPAEAWFGIPDGRGVTVFYESARNWPQAGDRELGNTHGCIVVDADGSVLVNTDTEAAVMVFAPSGERRRAEVGRTARAEGMGRCADLP